MKLIQGAGSPETGACWMSAIAWYVGEKEWTDAPECVDPSIRTLAIWVNDSLPSDIDREIKIGPMIFDVIGTKTKDPKVLLERKRLVVRFACSVAKRVLHLTQGGEARAAVDAALQWVASPCEETANAATDAANAAANAAYAAANAAADAAANAAYAADAAYAAAYAAANAAANAAAYAAYAARLEFTTWATNEALKCISDMCAIGTRKEYPEVRPLNTIPAFSHG